MLCSEHLHTSMNLFSLSYAVLLVRYQDIYNLKVSKSRKKKLEFSILPKNERNTRKNYPESFFKSFFHFFEELIIPKIALEIY